MQKLAMADGDETNLHTPTTAKSRWAMLSKVFNINIAESDDVPDRREGPVALHGIRRLSLTGSFV